MSPKGTKGACPNDVDSGTVCRRMAYPRDRSFHADPILVLLCWGRNRLSGSAAFGPSSDQEIRKLIHG